MYKSDLLTYSRGVKVRPSYIFMFHTHVHARRRYSCPSGVLILRLVPPSDRSPPSAPEVGRREAPQVLAPGLCFRVTNPRLRPPEGAISHLLRCFIGSPPWLAFTFRSEGEAFAPWCLSWRWAPFGHSCRPPSEPCRPVRRCF